MTQVPEKVLSWLYSVLHEYQDPQRTYSDTARTLSAYPSLSPRTEVYTFDNGTSALLLTVSGTIPVGFRGTTYRFPVKLWIPHAYPQEAPIVYVTPSKDMMARPGQHVDLDGRVYHPSLRDWGKVWEGANMTEFLQYLQQAFAKEPPVISRAQQQQYQRPLGYQQQQVAAASSPVPPSLPPKQQPGNMVPVEMPGTAAPPPRPPKPGEEYVERAPSRVVSRNGPPLPPLPGEQGRASDHGNPTTQYGNGYATPQRPVSQIISPGQGYQNGYPPGPPPLPLLPHQQQQYRSNHDRSPVSPVSPPSGYNGAIASRFSQTAPLPPHQLHQNAHQHQQHPQPQRWTLQQPYQPNQTFPQAYPPNQQAPQQLAATPIPQPKKQPPPDLLSDPFDVGIPGPSASGPRAAAPPIPPNPEKEHLIHALSATLSQQAQQKVQQTLSAIPSLQAQQNALRAAHQRLEAEIAQLEALDNTLASNESILRRSIQECDRTIETAKTKKQPPIDEVLVAPTMVAQQLWTLCAEEAACREAVYVLQKALDRGRLSGSDFVRQMRGLGREMFMKKALIQKVAKGLGLEVGR